MSNYKNFLIVSDMDGTFLGEKSELLSENLTAIQRFTDGGGLFTLATGRCYRVMDVIFPNAKDFVSGPAILCNGGYLYDFHQKKTSHVSSLDKNELLPLLDNINKKFPNLAFRISSDIGFLSPIQNDFFLKSIKNYLHITNFEPLDHHLNIEWHKIVFCAPEDEITALKNYLEQYQFSNLKMTTSSHTLLEILPLSAGKGSKVMNLKQHYPDRTIVAVGDFLNDLDLLQAADVAACPDNALDCIKDISSIHLCHHRNSCIADLINRLDSIKSK